MIWTWLYGVLKSCIIYDEIFGVVKWFGSVPLDMLLSRVSFPSACQLVSKLVASDMESPTYKGMGQKG